MNGIYDEPHRDFVECVAINRSISNAEHVCQEMGWLVDTADMLTGDAARNQCKCCYIFDTNYTNMQYTELSIRRNSAYKSVCQMLFFVQILCDLCTHSATIC